MADTYWMERFDPSRLRALRKERGLSQERLGELLGQERVTIVKYENGRRVPKAQTIHALAQALKVGVVDLLVPGPIDMPILRTRQNLTQGDIADALGISRPWYQRIEARGARIDRDLMRKLADLLKVDQETLAKLLVMRE